MVLEVHKDSAAFDGLVKRFVMTEEMAPGPKFPILIEAANAPPSLNVNCEFRRGDASLRVSWLIAILFAVNVAELFLILNVLSDVVLRCMSPQSKNAPSALVLSSNGSSSVGCHIRNLSTVSPLERAPYRCNFFIVLTPLPP